MKEVCLTLIGRFKLEKAVEATMIASTGAQEKEPQIQDRYGIQLNGAPDRTPISLIDRRLEEELTNSTSSEYL